MNTIQQLLGGWLPMMVPLRYKKEESGKQGDTGLISDSLLISRQRRSLLPSPDQLFKMLPAESESLMVKGVPVTIHWGQRYKPPSKSPRIPEGYGTIKGTLPKGLSAVATMILKKGNASGTYTPFTLNGKSYIALNEYHTHYAARPNDPPGKIYAITVFQRL